MINGLYQAQYASSFAPGLSAILKLHDGKVSGGDAGYDFSGHYTVDGTKIACTVQIIPQIDYPNIFLDRNGFEVNMVGIITESSIELSGFRDKDPNAQIRAILTKIPSK